jgi:hypothetical protein
MRYYDELARYEREGFDVIVDKTWEEIHVRDCFDDECFDIDSICSQIDSGQLDWFMLRVRAVVEGHEFGSAYLGGCLYSDAREVLSDGTAEDQIQLALEEAQLALRRFRNKIDEMVDKAQV